MLPRGHGWLRRETRSRGNGSTESPVPAPSALRPADQESGGPLSPITLLTPPSAGDRVPENATIATKPDPKPKLDRQAILARVEGDAALLKEVTDLFLADAPRLLAEIRESISQKDSRALERAAHALKGSVGNFGAKAAHDATFDLETMGRHEDLALAPEALKRLDQAVNDLIPELEALIKTEAA